jgi:hypothetical protein
MLGKKIKKMAEKILSQKPLEGCLPNYVVFPGLGQTKEEKKGFGENLMSLLFFQKRKKNTRKMKFF